MEIEILNEINAHNWRPIKLNQCVRENHLKNLLLHPHLYSTTIPMENWHVKFLNICLTCIQMRWGMACLVIVKFVWKHTHIIIASKHSCLVRDASISPRYWNIFPIICKHMYVKRNGQWRTRRLDNTNWIINTWREQQYKCSFRQVSQCVCVVCWWPIHLCVDFERQN